MQIRPDILIFMNKLRLAVIGLLAFAVSLPAEAEEMDKVESVEYIDVNKYMGKWYEYARIPNRFQNKCEGNVTADYTLLPDGNVQVINKCLEKNGKTEKAEGLAKIVDNNTNSKLKVSFFSIFGIHLFWGHYWVLYLDNDYSVVVVGEPSKKYGWILSRELSPESDKLEKAYEAIDKNGYKPVDFIQTKQGITN